MTTPQPWYEYVYEYEFSLLPTLHVYQILHTFVISLCAYMNLMTGRPWVCSWISPIQHWTVSRWTIIEWLIARWPCCSIGFAVRKLTSKHCSLHWGRCAKQSWWAICSIVRVCAVHFYVFLFIAGSVSSTTHGRTPLHIKDFSELCLQLYFCTHFFQNLLSLTHTLLWSWFSSIWSWLIFAHFSNVSKHFEPPSHLTVLRNCGVGYEY